MNIELDTVNRHGGKIIRGVTRTLSLPKRGKPMSAVRKRFQSLNAGDGMITTLTKARSLRCVASTKKMGWSLSLRNIPNSSAKLLIRVS